MLREPAPRTAATPAAHPPAALTPRQQGLAADLLALSQWLGRFGLPAQPWQPDPAWLQQPLPSPPLPPAAMATLSGFAQLRDSALLLGIDPLQPAQAVAFTRLVATVTARLATLLADPAVARGLDQQAQAWSRHAGVLMTLEQVQTAQRLGVFAGARPGAPMVPPPGPSLAPWRGFLRQLRPLLPMLALARQLDLSLSPSLADQLAAGLRVMRAIPLPPVPPEAMVLMARLTGLLSAVAQLRRILGVDPLEQGLPAVNALVGERLTAAEQAMRQDFGLTPAALLASLPQQIEYCPTSMATPAVVQAALLLELPAVTWQVPPSGSLPVLSCGLPVVSFCVQLQAALTMPLAKRPCGARCDAAALAAAAPQRSIPPR